MTLTFGGGGVVIVVESGLSIVIGDSDKGSAMSGEEADSSMGAELIEMDGICGGLSGGCGGEDDRAAAIKGQAVWCARRRVEVQIYATWKRLLSKNHLRECKCLTTRRRS
jgi:hypothetical protein